MKRETILLLFVILFNLNFVTASTADILKDYAQIDSYNQTKMELFEGVYPKKYIQSRASFEYSSPDSKVLIQIKNTKL